MSVMLDSLPRFHNLACIHTIKWLSAVSIYTVVVAFDTSAENKEMCSEDLVFRFVPKGSRLKVLIFILKGLFVMANWNVKSLLCWAQWSLEQYFTFYKK